MKADSNIKSATPLLVLSISSFVGCLSTFILSLNLNTGLSLSAIGTCLVMIVISIVFAIAALIWGGKLKKAYNQNPFAFQMNFYIRLKLATKYALISLVLSLISIIVLCLLFFVIAIAGIGGTC